MDADKIIQLIVEGKTYREIAEEFSVALSTLHAFMSKPEHSVRAREALEFSGNTYADMAEQAIIDAPSTMVEMQRARELAQHYRWKASKRSPKVYGDKVDITSGGEKIEPTIIKWGDREISV